MKKINFKENIKSNEKLCVAIAINIVFLVFCFLFFIPLHETNDDVFFEDLLSGAYSTGETSLLFINYFLSVGYHVLYNIIPIGNVYGIVNWIMVFISFCIITYMILERTKPKTGIILSVVVLFLFHSQFYLILQFTRVTFITAVAGYCLLLRCVKKDKIRVEELILAIVLIVFGALLRQNAFFAATAFAGIYGVSEMLLVDDKKKVFHNVKRIVICLVPIYVIIFAMYWYDGVRYQKEGWNDFLEYNTVRADLQDFGWPDYDKYEEEYKKLGISKDDYEWYLTNNIGDDSVLTTEKMQKIASMKEAVKNNISVTSFVMFIRSALTKNFYMLISILTYVGCWFYIEKRKYMLPITALFLLQVFLFYWYFLSGRIVERVLVPTIFCGLILILLILLGSNRISDIKCTYRMKILWLTMAALILAPEVYDTYNTLSDYHMDSREIEEVFEDKENIYVADHNVHGRSYFYYDALHRAEPGLYSNQVLAGGWLTRSPVSNTHNQMIGVDNFCEELIQNEHCFFYTEKYAELLGKYLRRHYDENTCWSVYKQYSWFTVYSYENSDCDTGVDLGKQGQIVEISGEKKKGEQVELTVQIDKSVRKENLEGKVILLRIQDAETGDVYTYRCLEDKVDESGNIKTIISNADSWIENATKNSYLLIFTDDKETFSFECFYE